MNKTAITEELENVFQDDSFSPAFTAFLDTLFYVQTSAEGDNPIIFDLHRRFDIETAQKHLHETVIIYEDWGNELAKLVESKTVGKQPIFLSLDSKVMSEEEITTIIFFASNAATDYIMFNLTGRERGL